MLSTMKLNFLFSMSLVLQRFFCGKSLKIEPFRNPLCLFEVLNTGNNCTKYPNFAEKRRNYKIVAYGLAAVSFKRIFSRRKNLIIDVIFVFFKFLRQLLDMCSKINIKGPRFVLEKTKFQPLTY